MLSNDRQIWAREASHPPYVRFYPPEQCLCHNLVRGLSGIECPSTWSSKCNKIPISFFLFTTLKGSSTLKQARRCLPIPLSFLSISFYSTAMFLGLFFFVVVLCGNRNQDSQGRRRRQGAISGSCCYLFCVNPLAGRGEGFSECFTGRAYIKHWKAKRGRGLKGERGAWLLVVLGLSICSAFMDATEWAISLGIFFFSSSFSPPLSHSLSDLSVLRSLCITIIQEPWKPPHSPSSLFHLCCSWAAEIMELRTVVATVENGEQDTVLKVLQIYNQEVSGHQTSA